MTIKVCDLGHEHVICDVCEKKQKEYSLVVPGYEGRKTRAWNVCGECWVALYGRLSSIKFLRVLEAGYVREEDYDGRV